MNQSNFIQFITMLRNSGLKCLLQHCCNDDGIDCVRLIVKTMKNTDKPVFSMLLDKHSDMSIFAVIDAAQSIVDSLIDIQSKERLDVRAAIKKISEFCNGAE